MRIEALGKPEGSKLLRLSLALEEGIIRWIRIRGDFFASPEDRFDRLEEGLAGSAPGELSARFDRLLLEEGIEVSGISGAAVAEVLERALAGTEQGERERGDRA